MRKLTKVLLFGQNYQEASLSMQVHRFMTRDLWLKQYFFNKAKLNKAKLNKAKLNKAKLNEANMYYN